LLIGLSSSSYYHQTSTFFTNDSLLVCEFTYLLHEGKEEKQVKIGLKDVRKSFKNDSNTIEVLRGITLNIEEGEFISIVGKSGSGKSSLINMITGIDEPSSGEIWINEVGLHRMNRRKISRWRGLHIGVVFQFFQLIPSLTVIENILLPMDFCNKYEKRKRKHVARELLKMVELSDCENKVPSQLSGGQQQRVAIARALANDPALIVADEPTGSLDSQTANTIFNLFRKLVADGKTVIMVTHDEELAYQADRVVHIRDGEIVNIQARSPRSSLL